MREQDGRVASWRRAGTLETLAEISRVNHQSDGRLNRSSTVAETALGPGLRVGSGLDHAAPESVPNQFSRGLQISPKDLDELPTRFRAITPARVP